MRLETLDDYLFNLWMETNYGKTKPIDKYIGYAIVGDDNRLYGVGMIFYQDGVWQAGFDSVQPPSPLAHRGALKLKEIAKQAGIEEIYSEPDTDVPNAEKWLERIGFVNEHNGKPWRLKLGLDF